MARGSVKAGEVVIPASIDMSDAVNSLTRDLPRVARTGGEKGAADFVAGFRDRARAFFGRELPEQGKQGAQRTAKEILTELRKGLQFKEALAKEQLARKLINPKEFRKAINEAKQELNAGLLAALKDLKRQGKENTAEYTRLARALRHVSTASADVNRQKGLLSRTMSGLVRSTKLWLSMGLAGALYAISRAFRALFGEVTKLDSALNESFSIMGDVPAHLRREMEQSARRLARELNLEADKLAQAFYFLASAGLTAEQSIAALPAVARFAKAGLFDLERAADLATTAQSALGLASADAQEHLLGLQRVTDVLVQANNMANGSVESFAESLVNDAAAALRIVNKEVEEGVAVLAAMADQGTKGEDAGTKLAIVLRDLQRAALENGEAFKKANVEVFDSTGKMRNIADVIGDLENRFDGMSDAQKRAELMQLGFQDRSVGALLILIGLSDKIREYEAGLRDAGGATQEVSQKQMRAIEQRLGRVSEQWTELKRRIGETIALPVAEWLMGIADATLMVDTPLEALVSKMEALGVAAETTLPVIIRQQISAAERQAAQLERDIEKMRGDVRGGAVGGAHLAALGSRERITVQSLDQAIEQRARAFERMTAEAARGNTAEATHAAEMVELLDELIAKEKDLAAVRSAITQAQASLPAAEDRAAIRAEIEAIDRQLERLEQRESAASLQVQKNLRARRAELAATLEPPKPAGAVTPEGGIPEDPESAKQRAAERLRIETELTERLFALTHTATEESIRQLDQMVEAYGKAGGVISAEMKAQVDAIRADLQLGGLIADAQDELKKLSAAKATPATMQALDALAASVRAQRDAVDEASDRWQQLDDLLQQVEERQKGMFASAAVSSFHDAFVGRMNDLKEMLARGLIDEDEFKQQGELAGEAFRDGILEVMERLREQGLLTEDVRTALLGMIPGSDDDDRAEKARLRELREQARAIEDSARAGVQLAQAFGLVDEEAGRAFQAISQIGAALGDMAAGDLAAGIPGVLGGVAALLDGFFADSPSEKARQELIERNTERLHELAMALQGFRVTDDSATEAIRGLQAILADPQTTVRLSGAVPSLAGTRAIERILLERFQLSASELDAMAKELGITIRDGSGRLVRTGLEQLVEALESAREGMTKFADTVDDRRREAQLAADINDEANDAAADLAREFALLSKFAPELVQKFMAGIDPSTPEGRAAMEEAVRAIFAAFQAGTLDIGNMTREEFLSILEGIEGALDELGAGGVSSGTAATRMSVNITEVQANRLLDIAMTHLHEATRQTDYLAHIAASVGGTPIPNVTIKPPRLPGSTPAGTIVFDGVIAINFPNVHGSASRETLVDAGEAAGRAAADAWRGRLAAAQHASGAQGSPRVTVSTD